MQEALDSVKPYLDKWLEKNTPPGKSGQNENKDNSQKIYPSWDIALQSFKYALDENRDLVNAKQADIYKWLSDPENKASDKHPYKGTKMPNEKTWQSYIRNACTASGIDTGKIHIEAKKNWLYRDNQSDFNQYSNTPKPQKTKQRPNKS
jgi:hypothetical protein